MVGDHGKGCGGELAKPGRGVGGHQRARHGVHQRLENIGHDDRISQGDAQRPRQGQPAQKPAGLAHALAAGGPGVFIGAQGAGPGPAAHGKLRRQPHIAENEYEQQVDQKKCAAAVAAQLVGEAPHIGHAHGGAHRGQDKAPAGAEILGVFLFHCFSRPAAKNPPRKSFRRCGSFYFCLLPRRFLKLFTF